MFPSFLLLDRKGNKMKANLYTRYRSYPEVKLSMGNGLYAPLCIADNANGYIVNAYLVGGFNDTNASLKANFMLYLIKGTDYSYDNSVLTNTTIIERRDRIMTVSVEQNETSRIENIHVPAGFTLFVSTQMMSESMITVTGVEL